MEENAETMQRLIADLRGDRSFDRLSRDCGGVPQLNRLHRMATKELRGFPEPETIRGLSRGLNVSATRIVMACARSLGLNVLDSDPDELVLQGAGALPQESKDLLMSMSRQLQSVWFGADTPSDGVSR